MKTQTEVTEKRQRALILAALCAAVAFSVLRAVTAAPKSTSGSIERVTLPEGRRQVRMMDDVYKTAVVATHQMYVQDPGTPAAVIWAKQVINKLKGKGWPDARIFATHDRPLNPENAPADSFERNAAAAFKKGKVSYEEVASGELRYATDLRLLDKKCVMCHVRGKPGDLVGGVSYRVPLIPTRK